MDFHTFAQHIPLAMILNLVATMVMLVTLPLPMDPLNISLFPPDLKRALTMVFLTCFTSLTWIVIDNPVGYVIPAILTVIIHILLYVALTLNAILDHHIRREAHEDAKRRAADADRIETYRPSGIFPEK